MKTKISINKSTIIPYFAFGLFVFVEIYGFRLIKWSSFFETVVYGNREKWGALVAVILGGIYFNSVQNRYLQKLTISIFMADVCMWFFAIIKYPDQRIITTYGRGAWYLLIWFSISLIYIMKKENSIEGVMSFINRITIIILFVNDLAGIVYFLSGRLMFAYASSETLVRNGKLYLSGGPFLGIVTIYNLYIIILKKGKSDKNGESCIEVFLFLLSLCVMAQSRAFLVSIIGTIIILLYFSNLRTSRKILFSFLLVTLGMLFIFSGEAKMFIASFSISGIDAGSTLARFGGYKYYWKRIMENPIFGIGFAGENEYYNLVHGFGDIILRGRYVEYNYSDVGIVGLLAQTGIFSIVLYFIPLARMYQVMRSIKYKIPKSDNALLISIFVYIIITSVTLIIIDFNSITAYAVIIALFEFYYYSYYEGDRA